MAFRGELLADVIPPQVITTLAVIEQTDDKDYIQKGALAFDEVLSQYGLKREEAYRYSLSDANALGPMQFTNRKRNGTYAYVVKRCSRSKARPGLRERRDESAERHESGGLPAGFQPGGRCGRIFVARIVPTRKCWASFRSPRTTADPATSRSSIVS